MRSLTNLPELVIDLAVWRKHVASSSAPIPWHEEGGLFTYSLDEWAASTLASLSSALVLAPSGFVRAADWSALTALVAELATATHPRVIAFIPTEAAMLRPDHLKKLLGVLAPLRGRPIAFLFAAKGKPLSSRHSLRGLRCLLDAHLGAWLVGVEPLVALDSVAHGASRAFVGTQASLRFPSPPDTPGYAPIAAGFIPGLLHVDLLEMRSPSVYADWYLSAPSPRCSVCRRAVDDYTCSEISKNAIREHNLRAMSAATASLQGRSAHRGLQDAAHDQRVAALVAHVALMPRVAITDIDKTLRNLVRLDTAKYRLPAEVRRLL